MKSKNKFNKYVITVVLMALCSSSFSQFNWEKGEVLLNSVPYCVNKTPSGTISFVRDVKDYRKTLRFGLDPEKGGVSVSINSEKLFFDAIYNAFEMNRIEQMAKKNEHFNIRILLDENGIPFIVYFIFRPSVLLTPEELVFIEKEILNNVRYSIRRQNPFGEECIYEASANIKFQDILNGEIPGLKRSEQLGKQKPEWER